ncbi:alkaline-phosphatase-like protein [Phyllosticta citrichinensis]
MLSTAQRVLLAAANLLLPIAVLTFAIGFFPYKPFLPGLAQHEALEYGAPPEAPFDKVVFMVVDALRSDFVYSNNSGFEFTQSLISSGAALPFTANARSPTVTMPRVKSMTTGSIPSFLDVILNLAETDDSSNLAHQDTWLAQLKTANAGKLVMYGDDTWLRLFPETFERHDGTSSFFVSDFTEVDNNVTRHVPDELRKQDWKALIMHYLGLDHIGHKTGPFGPNMIPKQTEMDGIVKQVYSAIETQSHLKSTLIILCGDHGMNDGGNHGGSAPGETSPALVFMSPKLKKFSKGLPCPTTPRGDFDYYSKVEQSDIAPTLAGLLGFPVPLNNLGVFITEFLPLWPNGNDRAQILLRNALQILKIVKATFPNPAFDDPFAPVECVSTSSSAQELACKWRTVTEVFQAAGNLRPKSEDVIGPLAEFCRSAQDILSSTASNYNLTLLVAGASLAAISVVLTLLALSNNLTHITATGFFYTAVAALYGVMMFASSYVEEEQHFWYWITTGWFVLLFLNKSRKTSFKTAAPATAALLLAHRVIRRWNQTGQKHAGAPDIAHSFILNHPVVLWTLVSMIYIHLLLRIKTHLTRRLGETRNTRQLQSFATVNTIILVAIAFLFKLSFTARDAPELVRGASPAALAFLSNLGLIRLARCVFVGAFIGIAWVYLREAAEGPRRAGALISDAFHDFLTLILLTQTRATNIPLVLLFQTQKRYLDQLNLTPLEQTVSALLLSHTSFFALGNSNAISSVDLSNAYNGVASYNIVAVGVLLFVSNWAGPIFWTSASVLGLLDAARWTRGRKVMRNMMETQRQERIVETLTKSGMDERKAVAAASQEATKWRRARAETEGEEESADDFWWAHFARLTAWTGAALVAVMVACTVLRTHLFIWTVFSPKYLFAMAWSVGFHLIVSGALGGLMWWTAQ